MLALDPQSAGAPGNIESKDFDQHIKRRAVRWVLERLSVEILDLLQPCVVSFAAGNYENGRLVAIEPKADSRKTITRRDGLFNRHARRRTNKEHALWVGLLDDLKIAHSMRFIRAVSSMKRSCTVS